MDMNAPNVSDEEFRKSLINMGFRIHSIPMQGNCLYEALAFAVKGDIRLQMEVRQELQVHIETHSQDFYPFFLGIQDFVDKLKKMVLDSQWGDEHDIRAASSRYNARITVFSPNLPPTIHGQQLANATVINLSFHNENHYNLLLDAREDNDDEEVNSSGTDENEEIDFNSSEDENEINEDYDSDDAQSSSVEDHRVQKRPKTMNRRGFEYVASKWFSGGRNYVDVVIILPNNSLQQSGTRATEEKVCLLDRLEVNTPETIMVLLDYRRLFQRMKKEQNFSMDWSAYWHRIQIPRKKRFHDSRVWLSSMMFPLLLLSTINFKWNGVPVEILCQHNNNSFLVKLLNHFWGNVREEIEKDMDLILENPDKLFCKQCDQTCIFSGKTWHFDLSNFLKVDQISEDEAGFWDISNIFMDDSPKMPTVLQELKRIHESTALANKLDRALDVLQKNYDNFKNFYLCSYLVIIFDGPTMSHHQTSSVHELLNDPQVLKSLYAGCTTNSLFRQDHFLNAKSAIYEVLTKTSRMFFVRTKKFHGIDSYNALKDEAFVIELLKNVLHYEWNKNSEKSFILLNKKSESRKLLSQSKRRLAALCAFPNSRVPVYKRKFDSSDFPGNYVISRPIKMTIGPWYIRTFKDVQKIYIKLQKTQIR